ncbi:hypothetical protein MKZ38_006325 [Zalerion maritima]|uniref:Uncharacterized protein n=1 Tax=Zalerion maritima TaxID=339359 RepID=A0AAD5WNR5_9PEZI|nr:hypothetical protein MKZ38_006325 [Zalerion maritima]
MASSLLQDLLPREGDYTPMPVPLPGKIANAVLSVSASAMLAIFLFCRLSVVQRWDTLPLCAWMVLAIYVDSLLFVFGTAIVNHGLGVNNSLSICSAAILLCLVCYVTTKIFTYVFLIEKAYIVRGGAKKRMQSKLYLFNAFGMMGVYLVIVFSNFFFRISKIENGQCIIGMERISMIPLISFDTLINVYLTILFLLPLMNLYSFKNLPKTPSNVCLRTCAMRTFIGAAATLVSSLVNLTVLMVLKGEPGWLCLMCCNTDIIFSAIVIHWVTSKDQASTSRSRGGAGGGYGTSRNCDPEGANSNASATAITSTSKSWHPDLYDMGGEGTARIKRGCINVDVDIVLKRIDTNDMEKDGSPSSSVTAAARCSSSSPSSTREINTSRTPPEGRRKKNGEKSTKENKNKKNSSNKVKDSTRGVACDTEDLDLSEEGRGDSASRAVPIASHDSIRAHSRPFEEMVVRDGGLGSGGVWVKPGTASL